MMLLIFKTKTGGKAARHHLLPIICLNNKLPQLKPTITQVLGKKYRPWKLSNYANPNYTMFTNENNFFFPNAYWLNVQDLVPCQVRTSVCRKPLSGDDKLLSLKHYSHLVTTLGQVVKSVFGIFTPFHPFLRALPFYASVSLFAACQHVKASLGLLGAN